EFWVADTGCGIAPAQLTHVFDRFWQNRPATQGGAGLGLAIAKGIVEAHEGRMRIESEFGVGTTLFFTLPVAAPG
ncbi:MAG TPA: HAMP domain-containing sensor histidine kinase, partial [Kofleriaceae bacterium]|nr:HAMP domain-containing sensor histidine kinase [Kofleriaceae bacterium]